MHESLRRRLLRAIESLPEERIYQVLDYIEFLESRYGTRGAPEPGGLQRFAERLEDRIRARSTLSPANLREAFELLSTADRVLSTLSDVEEVVRREATAAVRGETRPGGPDAPPPPGTAVEPRDDPPPQRPPRP